LIRLKNRSFDEPVYIAPVAQLAELQVLRNSLNDNDLLFSGHLTVFSFGSFVSDDDTEIHVYEPDNLLASFNPSDR
jgi:hypothetical protein